MVVVVDVGGAYSRASSLITMVEAFVSVKDEGGPLFLQHTHALAQDAVSRSAFLSNIHAEAAVGELYLLGMDVEKVRAWMDAVQVDDKLLGHLSSQQLAATLTVRMAAAPHLCFLINSS